MAILHKDKYYEKEKLYALFLAIAEHKYRFTAYNIAIFVCQIKESTYGTSKTFA